MARIAEHARRKRFTGAPSCTQVTGGIRGRTVRRRRNHREAFEPVPPIPATMDRAARLRPAGRRLKSPEDGNHRLIVSRRKPPPRKAAHLPEKGGASPQCGFDSTSGALELALATAVSGLPP
jgi:hypothetical protein